MQTFPRPQQLQNFVIVLVRSLSCLKMQQRRTCIKGLFIGINYTRQDCSLTGCIKDVITTLNLLHSSENQSVTSVKLLCDSPDDDLKQIIRKDPRVILAGLPTKEKILEELDKLVRCAREGDVLLLFYAGHGGRIKSSKSKEKDKQDETLIPLDSDQSGDIKDNVLYDRLVAPLPKGVRLTAVMDCCHSGTILDLPYSLKGDGAGKYRWEVEEKNNSPRADVFLISACRDSQEADDETQKGKVVGGACTCALANILRDHWTRNTVLTYETLLCLLRQQCAPHKQAPQFSSSKQFDVTSKIDIFGPLPIVTSPTPKKKPQKRKRE